MARSKQVSDEQIVGETLALVALHGPGLTLAQVGEQVGLSAATVMQRFGSKRSLMLAASKAWGRSSAASFDNGGKICDGLIEGMAENAAFMKTPEQVANVTASLHIDLADPEFRDVIESEMQRQRGLVHVTLDRAIEAGELKPCDTEELARHLQVIGLGSLQSWAIEPTGDLKEWLQKCLAESLQPWRV